MNIHEIANRMVLKSPPLPLLRAPSEVPVFIKCIDETLTGLAREKRLLLPNFHESCETVAVFSDYGGEHAESKFLTYSFLFVNWNGLDFALDSMHRVRTSHDLITPYKEFGFKHLEYGPIKRALPAWLQSAEAIPGLLFSLVVEKKVLSLLMGDTRQSRDALPQLLADQGLGRWKAETAEKLFRVLHVIGYLLAVLTVPGQKVFWMTDHDAIAANPSRTDAMARALASVLGIYNPARYGACGYALPFERSVQAAENRNHCDLLSIPDLAAGSLESIFTTTETQDDPRIRDGTNQILLWLHPQGIFLKRLTLKFSAAGDGAILPGLVQITPKQLPDNVTWIPVLL